MFRQACRGTIRTPKWNMSATVHLCSRAPRKQQGRFRGRNLIVKTSKNALIGFVLIHLLILVALNFTMGWGWVLWRQPNAFAGVAFVVALYATPLLILIATPFLAWVHLKAEPRRKHPLGFMVSLVCAALPNLLYVI
jgi:hypothetical protein